MRRANEIAAQGVVEGMKAIRPGIYDHDIAAVIGYEFARLGSVGPTFAINVMSGPNSFLNLLPLWSDYDHLDRQMRAGEGVFLDVGAEVGYYVSDIGRSAPVSGKFSTEQSVIIGNQHAVGLHDSVSRRLAHRTASRHLSKRLDIEPGDFLSSPKNMSSMNFK